MPFCWGKRASQSWRLKVQAVMVRESCLFCRETVWEQGGWGGWWSPCSAALQPAWYTQPADGEPQPGTPSQPPSGSITVAGKLHQLLDFQWLTTHCHSWCYKGEPALSLSSSSCRLPIVSGDRATGAVAASSEREITGEGGLGWDKPYPQGHHVQAEGLWSPPSSLLAGLWVSVGVQQLWFAFKY